MASRPLVIWMSPSRPVEEAVRLLARELGEEPVVRYVRLASPRVDPGRIVWFLGSVPARELYLVLVASPETVTGVLDLLAERGLAGRVHVLMPLIEIVASVPAAKARETLGRLGREKLWKSLGVVCYAGRCVFYRPVGFRLVSGLSLATRPLGAA